MHLRCNNSLSNSLTFSSRDCEFSRLGDSENKYLMDIEDIAIGATRKIPLHQD